jgi:hypothetical protein
MAVEIPENIQFIIASVLDKRPGIDLIIFYSRWVTGMRPHEIAERLHHTPEYVRLRLKAIYADIKQETDNQFGKKYKVSTIEGSEDAVSTEEEFAGSD